MTEKSKDDTDAQQRLVKSGASAAGAMLGALAGTAISTAIGVASGGVLIGVLAGSLLEEIIKNGMLDFAERHLSSRERCRVDTTLLYTINKIQELSNEGKVPREDWFHLQDETGRSSANEIFEGVLLKAKSEPQEKKLKFLGYFLANVAFNYTISPELANLFLKIADELSYRQFCYLSLIDRLKGLDAEPLRNRIHHNLDLEVLRREEMRLHLYDFGEHGLIEDDCSGYGYNTRLSEIGKVFLSLFELSKISEDDLLKLVRLLNLCNEGFEKLPNLPQRNQLGQYIKIEELKQIFKL